MPDIQEAVRMFQEKRIVLSVDDDPVNQAVIQSLFESESYTVHQALDGVRGLEALDESRADPPDVVLLDIMMPVMSGFAVLDRIKAEHPPELPVIFISAKSTPMDKCEGLKHLCHDYQPKPFEKDELLHRAKAFIVLRNLHYLESQKASQLESLCAIAPQSVVSKFQSGTSAIHEKFNNVHFLDMYLPFALFEKSLEAALTYLTDLHKMVSEITASGSLGLVKVLSLSGNGFRFVYSVNDEKLKETATELRNRVSDLASRLEHKAIYKPTILYHRTEACAGTLMGEMFHFITEHPYFTPSQHSETIAPAGKTDVDPLVSEKAEKELIDQETDNPFIEFEIMHAGRVASVPPLPWSKRINDKPKIIVVEEMDLNDISEIFLLRSRLSFLEFQKGVKVPLKERIAQEQAAADANIV